MNQDLEAEQVLTYSSQKTTQNQTKWTNFNNFSNNKNSGGVGGRSRNGGTFYNSKKDDTIAQYTHRNGMATAANIHSDGKLNSSGFHQQNNRQQSHQIIRHENVVAKRQRIPRTIQVLLGTWIRK